MSYHDPFNHEGVVLNVLTRTCNRPNRFRRCAESIKAQKTAVNLRHFVSIDRPCTYAKADVLVPATGSIAPDVPAIMENCREAPYNLYVNDLLAAVKDGWIIVLDDDDEFLREDSVAMLESYLDDPDRMIVVKFAMGPGEGRPARIMPAAHGRKLMIHDVPCASYVYHSKHKELGLWHGRYGGDYFAAANLAEELDVVWVDEVIAGTQQGPSCGSTDIVKYRKWKPREVPESPFVSIVIPVLNQCEYTKAVLQNIEASTTVPHEVIVVDNGSTDRTPEVLKQAGVTVIRNKKNRGWPASLNQGAAKATGTHLAFLNNDIVLPYGWLETLISHGRHAICPSYEQSPNLRKHFDRINKGMAAHDPELSPAGEPGQFPSGFAGFCFMVSREAWEQVGAFDEQFMYWYADNDYWIRLEEFEPAMSKNVLIHHFTNVTVKTLPDFVERREKDRVLFLAKWPERRTR